MEQIINIKKCKYCNNKFNSVWSKCDDCIKGNTIYKDGKECFVCGKSNIPVINSHWQSYCNKCYSKP